MRRALVILLVLGVVVGTGASGAGADQKKKKKVTEEYSFTAPVPNPNLEGCHQMGVESLQYQTAAFTTPGKGILDVTMTDYQLDWDLFVMDADGNVLGESSGDHTATSERVVIPSGAKEDLTILACNWSGGPTATATLTYTY